MDELCCAPLYKLKKIFTTNYEKDEAFNLSILAKSGTVYLSPLETTS